MGFLPCLIDYWVNRCKCITLDNTDKDMVMMEIIMSIIMGFSIGFVFGWLSDFMYRKDIEFNEYRNDNIHD